MTSSVDKLSQISALVNLVLEECDIREADIIIRDTLLPKENEKLYAEN